MALTDLIANGQAKLAEVDAVLDTLDTLPAEAQQDEDRAQAAMVQVDALADQAGTDNIRCWDVNVSPVALGVGSATAAADSHPIADANGKLDPDYIDWSQVRYGLLQSPLCHVLAPNQLVKTLAGELTWTRASEATYIDKYGVLQTAAIDEPREEAQGWLIEGASTNLQTRSQDFNYWVMNGSGVMYSTSELAPDGSNTAVRCSTPAKFTDRLNRYIGSGASAGNHTTSIWVKAAAGVLLRLGHRGGVGSGDVAHTCSGKWERIQCVGHEAGTGGSIAVQLYAETADEFYAWGNQIEAGNIMTSYIPTSGAAATRAADEVVADINGQVPSHAQRHLRTTVAEFSLIANDRVVSATTSGRRTLWQAKPDNYDRAFIESLSGAPANVTAYVGGGNATGSPIKTVEGSNWVVTVLKGTGFYTILNNKWSALRVFDGAPVEPNQYRFGWGAYAHIFGHLRNFRIYDAALNEHEVRALTSKESN